MSRSSTSSSDQAIPERFRNELSLRGLGGIAASLALALVLVAACEAAVHLVRTPKALPFESTRTGTMVELALSRREPPLDFAFVGTSQCVGAVSPRAFAAEWEARTGRSVVALNMAVNGAVVRDVEAFHEVVVSRLSPRTLVVLMGAPGSVGTGPTSASRSYGMDWMRGSLSRADEALMRSWLFRYRRQWRDARWQFYVARTRSLDGDLSRRVGPDGDGWVPSGMGFGVSAVVVDHGLPAGDRPREEHWTMSEDAVDAVRGLLRRAREQGTRVVLVVPPLPPRAARLYGDLEATNAEVRRGLVAAMGAHPVPLIDLHSPPGFGDAQFYDPWHLQGSAAADFSRLLARELASLPTSPG